MESELNRLIKEFYKSQNVEFVPGKTKIPVGMPIYGAEEVSSVLSTLLKGWITMGRYVFEFEEMFAKSVGCADAVATNSGSSANLIAMKTLTSPIYPKKVPKNSYVITSALNYPTTVSSIADAGLKPLLVDVDRDTFNINIEEIESALNSKTSAMLIVHFLGNPCDMKEIIRICNDNNVLLVEDVAEAQGAKYGGRNCGSFGLASTFSFFASHITATGEGGMLVTNDTDFADIARSIRAFGRACNCKKCVQATDPNKICLLRQNESEIDGIDNRFVYTSPGYSLKMTEMQGAFGLEQLKRLDFFTEKRIRNSNFYIKKLSKYAEFLRFQKKRSGTKHVHFGFPIIVEKGSPFEKKEIICFLEERQIETRPLMSGNITKQPFMKYLDHKVHGNLHNCDDLMENGFFIGTHPGIEKDGLEYITGCIEEFIDKKT
jgi:CDP-6-deoxy-D-xylo-4-hexulose-3-dehydrase